MRLSILLFDRFTALDVVGGYEVLARLPGVETEFVSTEPGIVAADTRRLGMVSYRRVSELDSTDILYVPGGPGVTALIDDTPTLDQLAALSATASWTVGICNGVAILGAAGLISNRRVTTNWAWRQQVSEYGATVVTDRYVHDGSVVTGAGVSASIDAALYLASLMFGTEVAGLLQLGIEYFPQPPIGPSTVDDVDEQSKETLVAWSKQVEPNQLGMAVPWRSESTT